ncbi:MAG: response regulator [Desulfobacterales bacterium]|nr:response regulator [Desulfobacterales bacterium]
MDIQMPEMGGYAVTEKICAWEKNRPQYKAPDDSPEKQIPLMHQAIAAHDADRVQREAHAIKGGAANLTADALAALAAEHPAASRNGDIATAERLMERFETEFEQMKAFVSSIV